MVNKNKIRLSESMLKKCIEDSFRKILKEEDSIDYPDDVYEWGSKVQALGYELILLIGKYRFTDQELYQTLRTLESEYNAVCGDLNTFDIADHYSSY